MSLLHAVSDVLFIFASGYVFYSTYPVQYFTGRGAGYRLYFRVLVFGLIWVVGLELLFAGLLRAEWLDEAPAFVSDEGQATKWFFCIALVCKVVLDGAVAALFFRRPDLEYEFNRKVFRLSDLATEAFLLWSGHHKETVLVTLESGEVYVGVVADFNFSANEGLNSFHLCPAAGGWRNQETQRVEFITPYPIEKSGEEKKFDVLLLMNRIAHIQSFDPEFYKAHFLKKPAPVENDEKGI